MEYVRWTLLCYTKYLANHKKVTSAICEDLLNDAKQQEQEEEGKHTNT
jgi:hypothetical protein